MVSACLRERRGPQELREFGRADVLVLAQDGYLILQEHVLVFPARAIEERADIWCFDDVDTRSRESGVSKGICLDLLAIWVFWPRAVATALARGLEDLKVCYWMYSCDKSSNLAIF